MSVGSEIKDLVDGSSNQDQSLGRAANRYVTMQMVMGIVGGVIFLVILIFVVVPFFKSVNSDVQQQNSEMKQRESDFKQQENQMKQQQDDINKRAKEMGAP